MGAGKSTESEATMNKTAIKNFAIWARNKLIADISYKAGLLGITDKEIHEPTQVAQGVEFYVIENCVRGCIGKLRTRGIEHRILTGASI